MARRTGHIGGATVVRLVSLLFQANRSERNEMDDAAVRYTRELIAIPSTSCDSNEPIAERMREWLLQLGFEVEEIRYRDPRGVPKINLVARRGSGDGGVAYFGHNDCVPVDRWTGPGGPFQPTLEGERLYGRGACDMKGSLGAMLAAAERTQASTLQRPIYYICTADEEVGYLGAREVAARSELYRELVRRGAWALIGEPTKLEVVRAHKGSVGFHAVAYGEAAHSSTRHGRNANLAMIPFLAEMKAIHDELEADPRWHNPEFDPPTMSWNIGINDGNTAVNIKAPRSTCTVYFRPMPGVDYRPLLQRARQAARRCGVEFSLMFEGPPVYTPSDAPIIGDLLRLTGQSESRTVAYATDACMFGDIDQLAIFGPGDIAQAHTADEWISLEQLKQGADRYTEIIQQWCKE